MIYNNNQVTIHSKSDFKSMRKAGQFAAEVLDAVADIIRPGITTDHINTFCHNMIVKAGAIPAPLNYRGFPKSICTSVNHVVCHGIPGPKILKEGDILNVDVTVIVDGWHGDSSRMYWVGKVSKKAQLLTQMTYDCMMRGIELIRPGARLGDIGHAIQSYAEGHKYSVVRDYCGHGIGRIFHEPPNVLHYGFEGSGMELQEGMFFTVEPMINAGGEATKLNEKDGWTVTTKDRSLSAQFEHTIGVTSTGYEIFTESPKGLFYPPYR